MQKRGHRFVVDRRAGHIVAEVANDPASRANADPIGAEVVAALQGWTQAERALPELKAETGLDAKVPISSAEAAACRLRFAADRLNRRRLRATPGYRPAAGSAREAPVRYTPAQHEALYKASRAAARAVWDACDAPRARRRKERDALWSILDVFRLVMRTRGRMPTRTSIPEVYWWEPQGL